MYDAAFYDTIRAGAQASAAVVVPLVLDHFHPYTVLDVGCGEGWWATAFAELGGCEVIGMDYPNDTTARLLGGRFLPVDLAHASFSQLARVDLAVALEVAEHLPPGRADSFVEDLCVVAPVVLFSAAIPGQGGTGHINEAWPAYWVEKFRANGYAVSGALRWHIWGDDRVENWYRQNLLFATRFPQNFPGLFATPLAEPWPVVHPVLFDARR